MTAPPSGSTTNWISSTDTGSGGGKGHEVESHTCVVPVAVGLALSNGNTLTMCSPSLGPSPPLCSPQTFSWTGAACRARCRGSPGLKLQEKVVWGAPPRAGVTMSCDWSVKSPVSGCLLVSSFTDTPMVGEDKAKHPRVGQGEGSERRQLGGGTLGLTFAIRYQGFPI